MRGGGQCSLPEIPNPWEAMRAQADRTRGHSAQQHDGDHPTVRGK
jgi:hypothetical protein